MNDIWIFEKIGLDYFTVKRVTLNYNILKQFARVCVSARLAHI